MGYLDNFRDPPAPAAFAPEQVVRELGDGLVLRRASAGDVDALEHFNRAVQSDPPDFEPETWCATWTRELMTRHPTARPEDFLLVDDTGKRRVASTLCFLDHTFLYEGVEVPAGQTELVGTHPDYRRRGLIRAQMDTVHAWSAERGQLMQLIDGIPWYYRQFGYEMALETQGGRSLLAAPAGEATGRLREAREDEAPALVLAYEAVSARSVLSCAHPESHARLEIAGRTGSLRWRGIAVLESDSGEPLAVVSHYPVLIGGRLYVVLVEPVDGAPWSALAQPVLHGLWKLGGELAKEPGSALDAVVFRLGTRHPLYEVAGGRFTETLRPYGDYLRVPDLPAFLRRVAPALEARLAASAFAGHDGVLEIDAYTEGWRLHWRKGRLEDIERFRPTTEVHGKARFPDRTFLHLVFGHRSLDDVHGFFPDCVVSDPETRGLLEALFPKRPSNLILAD